MLSCIWRSFTLSTTNPELTSLCVWHQAPQSLAYTAQAMLHNQTWQTIPASPLWSQCQLVPNPTPELSATSGQYVNPTSVTHCGWLISPNLNDLERTDGHRSRAKSSGLFISSQKFVQWCWWRHCTSKIGYLHNFSVTVYSEGTLLQKYHTFDHRSLWTCGCQVQI